MGWFSDLFKWPGDDESGVADLKVPEYYEDPDYRAMQDLLKNFGSGLLSGDVPDYYKAIGETGSKEFEDMLAMTTRDIQKGATESMALSGRGRGGQLAPVVSGAIADAATKLRYSDYERALTGKQNLMNTGLNVTTGVRSSGQQEGANKNTFNQNNFKLEMDQQKYLDEYEAKQDEEIGDLIATIAGVGLAAYTGGASLGLSGAIAGATDYLGGTDFLGGLLQQNKTKNELAGNSALGSISESEDEDYYSWLFS